jgi:hypothetical protein
MTGAAKLLVNSAAALAVRLMLREQRLMGEAAAGIDDPASDKGTIALHNAFSRSLARLEEMRAAAGARKNRTPDLHEYLAARAATSPLSPPSAVDAEPPAALADATGATA